MAHSDPVKLSLHFAERPMATLAYRADQNAFALEFDPAFVGEGHDLSPLNLPLQVYGRGVHIFQGSDTPFAGGLPGLIADSLPDAWGEKLLRQEMPEIRTIMGKLAAVGRRGPGAITFEPPLGSGTDTTGTLTDLSALVRAADALRTSPVPLNADLINRALARGGSSLGGAYPKISSHLPFGMESLDKKEVLIGGTTPSGHSPCVLKFERVGDEADGAVEFAFSLMAKAAGLRVPQTCLVNDGARRHFACARFDRYQRPDGSWGRHHVHTLSGMLHRRASDGAIDYEEFIRLTRNLCGAGEATECFRRAVFNLLSTNRDDHGRNHAFLYDERHRKWSLSPAYDLNPNVANVLIGLSWLGGAQIPEKFDKIMRLAEIGGISPSKARTIYDQVEEAVIAGWPRFAAKAGVPLPMIEYWQREMMVQTAALRKDAEHKPHRA